MQSCVTVAFSVNQVRIFLSPFLVLSLPFLPECATVSSLQMAPPLGRLEDNPLFCRCGKCTLRGGRILVRTTWYNHNPGGKGVKLPKPSLEINHTANPPALRVTRICQKRIEERRKDLWARLSTRDTGSGSVRMTSVNICAPVG